MTLVLLYLKVRVWFVIARRIGAMIIADGYMH
ncbi:MAG: hypothetical protein QOH27_3567 [Mycobacterium sp.]|nr:hypothetical protein [Mycobacterium sp.]